MKFEKIKYSCVLLLLAAGMVSCRQNSFDEQCTEQAADFTEKQCPKKISEGVVLDSMTYSKALRCITYHYTMSGKLDDAKLVQGNSNMIHDGLRSTIANSVELKRAKDAGVNFRYVYVSASTRKPLASITLTKKDYSE